MLTALRNIKTLPVENKFTIFNQPTVAEDLGKPTIKLEFETNEELVNFQNRISQEGEFPYTLRLNKKGEFEPAEELEGIGEEQEKENFYKEILSYITKITPQNFSYSLLEKQLGQDENGIFKINTPIGEVNFKRSSLFERDKHIIKHIGEFFNVLKPTLEKPYIIFKSFDRNNIPCYIYLKCFKIKGKNKVILLSAVDPETYNVNTIFNPDNERDYIWKKYKKGGKNRLYTYPSISSNANSINGLSANDFTFEIVEIHLPCKVEDNFLNNQIFNQKSLGAAGDLYLVRDLRTRARKEPNELLANKNLKFTPLLNAKIENFNKKIYSQQKYFNTKIEGYKEIRLIRENNKTKALFNFFVPTQKKDGNITGNYIDISTQVDLSQVYNIYYRNKENYDYNVLIVDLENRKHKETPTKLYLNGYVTNNYYIELRKTALKELEEQLTKSNLYTTYQLKLFSDYYSKPNSLNAPNDLYIISDTRLKSKKDLDEIKSLQKYNIQPFYPEEYTNDTGVKLVLLKNIKKDTKRFQNRENAESSESVNRIINAVKKGDFNWAAFDPIVLWKDPQDGNIYVLSGHSRTRAFEILSEQGATVNGKDFNRIPARFFEGSERDAIDFALNSNTLSTKETDVERAKYYRRLIGTMPEYKLKELAEQNEGKNANRILAYAHLRPGSYTLNALTRLQDSSTENAELVKTVADWIGRLFIQFPQLTLEHDKEIFNWLMLEGHYGIGAGKINNYRNLLDVIRLAVPRLQSKDGFESEKRLNLSNVGGESDSMKNYNEKLKQLNNEIKNANAELKAKRKEFLQRQKLDSTITHADIERALKPYNDNIINLQKQIIDLNANKSKYLDADKKQLSIFGQPDPDIYNNCELWYGGMKPTYKLLESYDSMFDAPDNKNKLLGYGLNDTLQIISATVKKYYKDCAKIAAHLKADTEIQSAFNLWHWLHKNIRYNYDAQGKEQIRSPRRVWADRFCGVDCDCLSVFVYCTLLCMHYKPKFEIVAFKNKQQYSHIFVNLNGIVIDRVWFIFNSRPPNITKTKFYTVNINTLEGLCGMF